MSTFFWLLGWIFDWRVLAVAGVIAVLIAYRLLGPRISAAVAAVAVGLVLWRQGWQRGARSEKDAQKRRDDKAVATRDKVQVSVNRASTDEVKRRLSRWVTKP